jgi:hypothetical protein
MILPGAAGLWFVGTAMQAALGKVFCPKEKILKAWKPNRLRRELGLVSAKRLRSTYAKAYLSCLEWDISAQLFPSHWEFDSCAIGEWW